MSGSEDDPTLDASLIRLSLKDPDHFRSIFERHAPVLHGYLSKRAPRSVVDDLVSETFVSAFRTRHNYDFSYPDARPWLFGIATNTVRHHQRGEGRRLIHGSMVESKTAEDDIADQVVSDIISKAEVERVQRALAQIDDRYSEVLMLVAGPGLTYEEVARALDIPIGTVRSRMSRGRAQLRELVGLSGQYEHEGVAVQGASHSKELPQ
jgi:RNA polymerase sigma-70 factor (ECF subfamily)